VDAIRNTCLLEPPSHANSSAVLKAETETCMRLLGVDRIEQLGMQHVSLASFCSTALEHTLTHTRSTRERWKETSTTAQRH